MKVLHVMPSYIPAYHYGGPVRAVHGLCRELVKKGLEISVFTTNAGQREEGPSAIVREEVIDGVRVIYYPIGPLMRYYYSIKLGQALKDRISEFDLVHIHSVFLYPTFAAARWCQRKKIPYIINPFGALDPDMLRMGNALIKKIYIKLIERNNLRKAAAIHVASAYEKEQLIALGFSTPAVVIPRGLDLADYKRPSRSEDFMQRYPRLRGKDIILFLGRVHFKKGLDMLPAALKYIIEKGKDAYLIIAGPNEKGYADTIKVLFKRLGLADRIIFTDMLLGEDKLAVFYASDIFVLPSYGENFGNAVLEAMACGLPVVVTDKVGLCEDIKESNAGIITNCDSKSIAEAIIALLDSEGLRKDMGKNGRRLTERRFRAEDVADEMAAAYSFIRKGADR